jgi:AhpD family alkylhydroperoxidase
MLVAIMVEHFIHVESNPPPCRVVHECRYCTSGHLLTARARGGTSRDCIAAAFFIVSAILGPFNQRVLVGAESVEFLI